MGSSSLHTVSFSSSSPASVSSWDYINLIIVRPILAISFVFLFISLGWFLAWKLVLVHVPLVQEIFGLRKKPAKPKPPTRRLSKLYNTDKKLGIGWEDELAQNPADSWIVTRK